MRSFAGRKKTFFYALGQAPKIAKQKLYNLSIKYLRCTAPKGERMENYQSGKCSFYHPVVEAWTII